MNIEQNFELIGKEFVKHFYTRFDTDRSSLQSFYGNNSMLTFEGIKFCGTQGILEKLTGLPFGSVIHVITTVDSQPTVGNGVVVFVVGQLKTDNDPPHSFSETFVLQPTACGSLFIQNEMFRLSLHDG